VLVLKMEYLENYLVNFDETNVVEFRIRCSLHITNLKEIWKINFLAISVAMEWPSCESPSN